MKVCCATGFSLRPRKKQACNQATTIVGIWQQITEMIILCGNNKVRLSSLNEELIRKKGFYKTYVHDPNKSLNELESNRSYVNHISTWYFPILGSFWALFSLKKCPKKEEGVQDQFKSQWLGKIICELLKGSETKIFGTILKIWMLRFFGHSYTPVLKINFGPLTTDFGSVWSPPRPQSA